MRGQWHHLRLWQKILVVAMGYLGACYLLYLLYEYRTAVAAVLFGATAVYSLAMIGLVLVYTVLATFVLPVWGIRSLWAWNRRTKDDPTPYSRAAMFWVIVITAYVAVVVAQALRQTRQ